MVSILGGHRRADQFAAVVDGRTPADHISSDLRPLADLVEELRSEEAPAPRRDFSVALREQLMVEAQTALTPVSPLALPPRRGDRARQRRLTAAAAVFTLVGGSAGLAAAAEESLPGDALYPIKRGIEDVRLGVQSEPADKGRSYLDQAEERLDEAAQMVETGAPSDQVAQSVDLFVVQAVAGSSLLLESFNAEGSSQDVETLRDFSAETLQRLQSVAKAAPADIQDELARAAVVVQGIDQQASDACGTCSSRPTLDMPVLMAQATQISQAMDALRSQEINNDHPALTVEIPTKAQDTNNRRSGSGSGQNGSGDGDRSSTEGPRLSVGAELPSEPRRALEKVDEATGGLVGKVSDDTEETVKQIQDGVKDSIDETLTDSPLGK